MELAKVLFLDGEQMIGVREEVADALGIRLAGTQVGVHDEPAFLVERDERVELALHAIKVVDKSNSLQDIAPRAVPDLQSRAEWPEPFATHLHIVANLVVYIADIAETDDIHELLVVSLELLVLLHGLSVISRFLFHDTIDVLDAIFLLLVVTTKGPCGPLVYYLGSRVLISSWLARSNLPSRCPHQICSQELFRSRGKD